MVERTGDSSLWMDIDPRPMLKGWGPGDYFCTCSICNRRYIGAKRSWMCAHCAYADFGMDGDRDW